MSEQIKFYRKSWLDQDRSSASIVLDTDNIPELRNRSNRDGAMTESGKTEFTCTFESTVSITDVFLLAGNWNNYTIRFYNITDDEVFPTLLETKMGDSRGLKSVQLIYSKFDAAKMTVDFGTAGVRVAQIVACLQLGQLEAWAEIKKPEHNKRLKKTKMASGKTLIVSGIEEFSVNLSVKLHSKQTDMALIEDLHNTHEGFLVSLSGGNQNQFFYPLSGYRLQDLYLMQFDKNYVTELYKSLYTTGVKTNMSLIEVVT